MISFDTNILLCSLNPSSSWHAKATQFLEESLTNERVAIADYVLVELYTLLRNPAVMKKPLDSKRASELVLNYFKYPSVIRIENAPVMDFVWKMAEGPSFARRRIFDARLGMTLRHHGVTHFATANVKDFKGMGFEKVWNPLIDEA
ncbi:VapC toxin family PIN domain ribonuclease [Haloferula chungangensis]|uniref:VapC toxin family PIN domain ribonuclease n=1 Tax=Haloferula chungangensis TaxID=1048331 RepID=A0ABW2L8X3_9BACT